MHLRAVKQRTTFAVNIANLVTSWLFTVRPEVLPVTAVVFYELNPQRACASFLNHATSST